MEDLKAALVEAARLIELDERAILLFQRIEKEIKSRETQESILERARCLAAQSMEKPR